VPAQPKTPRLCLVRRLSKPLSGEHRTPRKTGALLRVLATSDRKPPLSVAAREHNRLEPRTSLISKPSLNVFECTRGLVFCGPSALVDSSEKFRSFFAFRGSVPFQQAGQELFAFPIGEIWQLFEDFSKAHRRKEYFMFHLVQWERGRPSIHSDKLPSPNQKHFRPCFAGEFDHTAAPLYNPARPVVSSFWKSLRKTTGTAAQSRCRCSAGIEHSSFRAH
jgi:hypothetical protein